MGQTPRKSWLGRFDLPTIALAVAHALLFVAAFSPINWAVLIVAAPVPLAWLAWRAKSLPQALITVLLVQTAMWMWIGRWLWQITEAGLIPYALIMAGWGVVFVWLFRRIAGHRLLGRLPMAVTLPVVWVGVEFLRGEIAFDGYPWFLLAHPLVQWPVAAQSADLFGGYFLSFLVAMVAGLLLGLMRRWMAIEADQPSCAEQRRPGLLTAVIGLLVAAHLGYGIWRVNETAPLSPGPSLLVVQTNLPQDNKMRSSAEEYWQYFQSFMGLTTKAHEEAVSAGQVVDLIVWPETMVTGWGFEGPTLELFNQAGYWPGFRFAMATEVMATELETPMLVGSPAYLGVTLDETHALDWEAHYNAAYLVTPRQDPSELGRGGFQRYDKVFLTPFGETMPYIRAWPWLQDKMLAVAAQGMRFDVQPGTAPRVLDLSWNGQTLGLATPICFEATMGRVCRGIAYAGGRKRADIMLNLTNDGWFGWHDPGRVQHAQIARLRAIENRLPMVRSANTGMSVSIDSVGRLVDRVGEGPYGTSQQAGTMLTHVQLDARQTLYGRIGDVWGWLCLGLVIVGLALMYWSRK